MQPAVFEVSEGQSALLAAGGTQPTHIQQWDMHHEQQAQTVSSCFGV